MEGHDEDNAMFDEYFSLPIYFFFLSFSVVVSCYIVIDRYAAKDARRENIVCHKGIQTKCVRSCIKINQTKLSRHDLLDAYIIIKNERKMKIKFPSFCVFVAEFNNNDLGV